MLFININTVCVGSLVLSLTKTGSGHKYKGWEVSLIKPPQKYFLLQQNSPLNNPTTVQQSNNPRNHVNVLGTKGGTHLNFVEIFSPKINVGMKALMTCVPVLCLKPRENFASCIISGLELCVKYVLYLSYNLFWQGVRQVNVDKKTSLNLSKKLCYLFSSNPQTSDSAFDKLYVKWKNLYSPKYLLLLWRSFWRSGFGKFLFEFEFSTFCYCWYLGFLCFCKCWYYKCFFIIFYCCGAVVWEISHHQRGKGEKGGLHLSTVHQFLY